MKVKKLAMLLILMGTCFASAYSSKNMTITRSYNARGEDLASTYILNVASKCFVQNSIDDDLDNGAYRYCYWVQFQDTETACNTIATPVGAIVYKTVNDAYTTAYYCGEWTTAAYPELARSQSSLCNAERNAAHSLWNVSKKKSKSAQCKVINLD